MVGWLSFDVDFPMFQFEDGGVFDGEDVPHVGYGGVEILSGWVMFSGDAFDHGAYEVIFASFGLFEHLLELGLAFGVESAGAVVDSFAGKEARMMGGGVHCLAQIGCFFAVFQLFFGSD